MIIVGFFLFFVLVLFCGLGNAAVRSRREREAKREAERIAAMRRLAVIEREQARQRKEQDRQRKEQERQAAQLEKHEKEIEKLKFSVQQWTAEIEYQQQRIADLDARTDYLQALQAATNPGSSAWDNYQKKIIVLRGQVNTAETKLAKAQWQKAQAERRLA